MPSDAHVYLVPQTLMKFHPAFDAAIIAPILAADPRGIVVITYSASQAVWQAGLQRRLSESLGAARQSFLISKHQGIGSPSPRCLSDSLNSKLLLFPAAASRVRFLSALPHDDFLDLLRAADVVLDPFPFGGGVTTLEALAMGTPVVTLPSRQTVVRLAAGFLRKIGLAAPAERAEGGDDAPPPLVVASEAAYVDSAVAIATSGREPGSLRSLLEESIARACGGSSLFEDEEAAREWTNVLLRLGGRPAEEAEEEKEEIEVEVAAV